MKVLGIDYGLSKTGLALGDDVVRVSTPLEVIKTTETFVEDLCHLVEQEGVERIVVGIAKGSQEQVTREFIKVLEASTSVPVITIDEAYTSVESQRIQEESGSKVEEDALAAMLILESYFNQL